MSTAAEPTARKRALVRKRTQTACDRCRIKKSKCDGGRPCGTCSDLDVSCKCTPRHQRGNKARKLIAHQKRHQTSQIFCDAIEKLYLDGMKANIYPDIVPEGHRGKFTAQMILRIMKYFGPEDYIVIIPSKQQRDVSEPQPSTSPYQPAPQDMLAERQLVTYGANIPTHASSFAGGMQVTSRSNGTSPFSSCASTSGSTNCYSSMPMSVPGGVAATSPSPRVHQLSSYPVSNSALAQRPTQESMNPYTAASAATYARQYYMMHQAIHTDLKHDQAQYAVVYGSLDQELSQCRRMNQVTPIQEINSPCGNYCCVTNTPYEYVYPPQHTRYIHHETDELFDRNQINSPRSQSPPV